MASSSIQPETPPPVVVVSEPESPRVRRRRGMAFFETKVDDSDTSSSSKSNKKSDPQKKAATITTPPTIGTTPLLFVLGLFLALLAYLSLPSTSTSNSTFAKTTPLAPLLSSLATLTTLSPALPFTGLATHILARNLTATANLPTKVLHLAQQAKTAVEEFSAEENVFQEHVLEGLGDVAGLEKWSEEGMKEGYLRFFEGREEESRGLVGRIEGLEDILGRLKKEMGGSFEKEKKVVEWLGLVFRDADGKFKAVVEEAKKGREWMGSDLGKGWMSEGLLKREKVEIEKYREVEKKTGDLLMGISKTFMEEEGGQNVVEGKLEKGTLEGRMDWW